MGIPRAAATNPAEMLHARSLRRLNYADVRDDATSWIAQSQDRSACTSKDDVHPSLTVREKSR